MKEPAFLSIDIDYWNNYYHAEWVKKSMIKTLEKIYAHARQNSIPLSCVTNHQQMLKLVEAAGKQGVRTLVNVDTHDDVVPKDVTDFNCGTWISYVSWRKEGKYIWIHRPHCGQYCGGYPTNGYDNNEWIEWLRMWEINRGVRALRGRYLGELFKKYSFTHISFCESPSYTDKDLLESFTEWREGKKIRYIKGRKNEDFGYFRRPK